MMRTPWEMRVMLIITGITNFCMFPAIVNLHRQGLVFEAFIGMFTMVTSFMYHCCDSIDGPIWLTEGQWHRLDNIGSIMSFISWSVYLMDLQHPLQARYLHYAFLALVLVMQEKNPWDETNTFVPIVLGFVLFAILCAIRGKLPLYSSQPLRRGLCLLLCAVLCFVRGLDDDNDPFRFFHGCWHAFIGAAAYFNFQWLPRRKSPYLPLKRNQ